MADSTFRAFVAIELPVPLRRAIAALLSRLSARDPSNAVRWVRPESIHVTLKFLGETPEERVTSIETALASAVADVSPFDLALGPLGFFHSRRGNRDQVAWVGLEGQVPELQAIASRVETALVDVNFRRETRPFVPHLTVGRVRRGARSAPGCTDDAAWPPLDSEFRVDMINLMESDLRPEGARYTRRLAIPVER